MLLFSNPCRREASAFALLLGASLVLPLLHFNCQLPFLVALSVPRLPSLPMATAVFPTHTTSIAALSHIAPATTTRLGAHASFTLTTPRWLRFAPMITHLQPPPRHSHRPSAIVCAALLLFSGLLAFDYVLPLEAPLDRPLLPIICLLPHHVTPPIT